MKCENTNFNSKQRCVGSLILKQKRERAEKTDLGPKGSEGMRGTRREVCQQFRARTMSCEYK